MGTLLQRDFQTVIYQQYREYYIIALDLRILEKYEPDL